MFKDSAVFSSFAVDDTDAARRFYGETLGLDVRENVEPGLLEIHAKDGGAPILVYPKPDHTPAEFTVLNLPVPDIKVAVDALIAAGIEMKQYDTDELKTDTKGIVRGEHGPAIAWFEDPAGNIVSVLEVDRG